VALSWGESAIPGVAGTNFPLVSNASIDYFAAKGMNTIRLPFLWERLQPVLYGDLDWTYANYIVRRSLNVSDRESVVMRLCVSSPNRPT
jgi:aryl-phospho-beta-D-glucosidase BglC (GH1 family)